MQNVIWKILTREELIALYHNEMQRDFPPDEIRPLKTLLSLYDSERYCPYGVFAVQDAADGDGQPPLLGYLNVVHASGCDVAFLDYFATAPTVRGGGLGAQLLDTLCEKETARGATALLWEAETPSFAPDATLAARRYAFYTRCGAQETALRQCVYGVWFDMLYRPCAGDLTPATTEPALLHIYHQLMDDDTFATQYQLQHITD